MKPLIISLGNRYRCDDGIGPHVLDILVPLLKDKADLLENRGDISSLINLWQPRDHVILVDAGCSDEVECGHIYQFNGLSEQPPTDPPVASSHALNISNAIELGKLLNSLPRSLTIYTIVGQNFSHGEEISPKVLHAAGKVAADICNQIKGDNHHA